VPRRRASESGASGEVLGALRISRHGALATRPTLATPRKILNDTLARSAYLKPPSQHNTHYALPPT